jgi:hypothetical protein
LNRYDKATQSFVRLSNLRTYPLDRLSRYEAALWRKANPAHATTSRSQQAIGKTALALTLHTGLNALEKKHAWTAQAFERWGVLLEAVAMPEK